MIVVYCLDNIYVPLAEISIQTLKRHNPEAKIIIVSEKPLDVKGMDENYVFDLGGQHRNRGIGDRISNAAYLKLLLPKLPYEKIIYLDGDTIIQKPLDEIWNMDIEYIGVTESHKYGKIQAKDLGLDRYALSGFMVMNLNNLRDFDFTNKCLKAENDIPTPNSGWQHDETIINFLMRDKLTFLPLRYHYCYHREYETPVDYNDVSILHIVGKDKSYMFQFERNRHYLELEPIRQDIQGKSVAIVGNAQNIFDFTDGKEIDKKDFIIRFNRGFIIKPECQGKRTDFLITATNLSDYDLSRFNAKYTANRSNNYHSNCDFTINNRDRCLLAGALGSQPSTGFMAINICLYFGAKEINLYGFDFGNTETWYHTQKEQCQHNYNKEQEVIKGYVVNGLVKIKRFDFTEKIV